LGQHLKMFDSSLLGRKDLKNNIKNVKFFSLPGAPTCLRLALIGILIVVVAEVQPSIS